MSPEYVTDLLIHSLTLALLIASPMLILGLVTGVTISIFQAATQIQEMTLTFIPKIVMVIIGLAYMLPWMINKLTAFTISHYTNIPDLIR